MSEARKDTVTVVGAGLVGSLLSAVVGYVLLRYVARPPQAAAQASP